jgi:uncharacterized damage-inducible protein DinB
VNDETRPFAAFPADLYRAHARYDTWMNERLYDCAARLISSLDQDVYPAFDVLRRERSRTDADVEEFAAGLVPARLGANFDYKRASGELYTHPLWWAICPFFNPQTHHRGQVTTLLKQLGIDPGVTDLVIMVRKL